MSIVRAIRCDECGRTFAVGRNRQSHDARALLKGAGWLTGCRGSTGHARYQSGARDYCPCIREKRGPICLPVD